MKVTKRISNTLVIRISTAVFLLASGAGIRKAGAQAIAWTEAPGAFSKISAGWDDSLWSVDYVGNIHKWNRVTQGWDLSTGNLGANSFSRIAVDRNGRPWVMQGRHGGNFPKGRRESVYRQLAEDAAAGGTKST